MVKDKYYIDYFFLLGKKDLPEKKKLSVKTRLILIGAMFALVNVVFFATESFTDKEETNETSEEQIIEEEPIIEQEEEQEEELYYKFNPPSP